MPHPDLATFAEAFEPEDFPFKAKTRGHRQGDSVRKVWLKNALRWR